MTPPGVKISFPYPTGIFGVTAKPSNPVEKFPGISVEMKISPGKFKR